MKKAIIFRSIFTIATALLFAFAFFNTASAIGPNGQGETSPGLFPLPWGGVDGRLGYGICVAQTSTGNGSIPFDETGDCTKWMPPSSESHWDN